MTAEFSCKALPTGVLLRRLYSRITAGVMMLGMILTRISAAGLAVLMSAFGAYAFGQQGSGAADAPTMRIVSLEIPYTYQPGGSGPYNQVFDRLVDGYAGDVVVDFLPSGRARRTFLEPDRHCLFVSTDSFMDPDAPGSTVEFIGPVLTLSVTAYVRADGPPLSAPADLRTTPFAIDVNLRRIAREHGLEPLFSIQDQVQMVELLTQGRVEALVGFDYDLELISNRLNVRDKVRPTALVFETTSDGITCKTTPETAAFRALLRKNLDVISSSGWLEKTLSAR